MKVRVLSQSDGRYHTRWDTKFLIGALQANLPNAAILRSHIFQSPPEVADVNFFLETPNALHYTFARENVLIADSLFWTDAWKPLLCGLTGIVVKNARDKTWIDGLVTELGLTCWVMEVAWMTHDITPGTPRFHHYLVQANDTEYGLRLAGFLVKNWRPDWGQLRVIYDHRAGKFTTALENVQLTKMVEVKENELDDIRRDYGYHFAITETPPWLQALSVGAIVPDLPTTLTMAALVDAVELCEATGYKARKALGQKNREQFEARYARVKEDMAALAGRWAGDAEPFVRPATIPVDPSTLPEVTILTPTADRPEWIKLAKYCFLMQNYPREKLNWIIYDTGKNYPCKSVIADLLEEGRENVYYVMDDWSEDRTVADCRNRLVELATTDIVVHFDDDDYYPPESVVGRVREMLVSGKKCAYSTTIPMYHVDKFGSAINVPPHHLSPEQRVSEATMVYTRDFWAAQKFEGKESEGAAFLQGRVTDAVEIDSTPIIVTLLHKGNSGRRQFPKEAEGNGCYFKWSDELFKFITEIGQDKLAAIRAGAGEGVSA